jgi:hypothetical protein
MKTLVTYLLVVAWCACWFCACGGAASVGDISNSQAQNQTNEGDIKTAQEACTHCANKYAKGEDEETLSDCVTRLGHDVSDC